MNHISNVAITVPFIVGDRTVIKKNNSVMYEKYVNSIYSTFYTHRYCNDGSSDSSMSTSDFDRFVSELELSML